MARRNGVLGSVGRGLRTLGALSALLTGLLACGGAHEEPERTATRSEATASIDVRRSLVVTEQVIVSRAQLPATICERFTDGVFVRAHGRTTLQTTLQSFENSR
jgi:hypothetical protein